MLETLGCTVHKLHCDPDGRFPNHHPDPTVEKNLVELIAKVKETGADLGIAFQLTNISRDVMEDAGAGRVYLPASWLAEEDVDPARIDAPEHRPGVARVTRRLLMEAERYYDSAARNGSSGWPWAAES